MQLKRVITGVCLCVILCCAEALPAQDTAYNNLDDVIVTATKTATKLGNTAVPASIIQGKTIQQAGSLRLNDILNEQAGLFITNSYAGLGLQMQGFDPDYTLILIDGEPIVGRNSGVLDLSRISVSNIKRIEIVKGPSSSLYGSDAMAGVINIITEKQTGNYGDASLRYGSFGTVDANAGGGITKNTLQLGLQGNYYGSAGYNLTNSTTPTQLPFSNYTIQPSIKYTPNTNTNWLLNTRYFNESIVGDAKSQDININNTFTHRFSNKINTALHIYCTTYSTNTSTSSYYDYFKQSFTRLEDQTDWNINKKLQLTAGSGWVFDNVASSRYDTASLLKTNNIGYLFAQAEWKPLPTYTIIGGLRYDYNQNYRSKLSPKLALQKIINSKLRINASVGAGFKAPDFRQLYLDFTNTIPGTGYTVLGNTEVAAGMQQLEQEGQIQTILINPSTIKPLKAETSTGINIGADYAITKAITFNTNFFRNDINNLILTQNIAQKTNGMYVYSYFNITRAYTDGVELLLSWQLSKQLQLSGSYQLLYTGNKDDIDRIKNTKVYGRANGNVYILTTKDYKGLLFRSRHSANIKAAYQNASGWFFTTRLLYRSGWGVLDADGNGLLNRGDTFSKDYWQLNISAGKYFNNGFALQTGSDNLLNWKDVLYSPNVPGRIVYATISYSYKHQHKN